MWLFFRLDPSLPCSANCSCHRETYDPICIDTVTYFSACHAGCSTQLTETVCTPNITTEKTVDDRS